MKTFTFACFLVGLSGAVVATASDELSYTATANAYAARFLQQSAHADSDLPAFLEQEKITGAKLKEDIGRAVKLGRQIAVDAAAPGTPAFDAVLAETRHVAYTPGTTKPPAPAVKDKGKAGDSVETDKPDIDTILRKRGVSLSLGGGVVTDLHGNDASVATAILRYNILQARSTALWNHLVKTNPIYQDGYSKVGYRNLAGEKLQRVATKSLGGTTGQTINAQQQPEVTEFLPLRLTAFGPFIGRAVAGEGIVMGTKRERPYLLGLSFGFDYFDQAGSLFYIDAGSTLSPTSGFSHSKPYIGLSVDGLIFGKIVGLGKPKEPSK